jgi:hypothetical protein
MTTQRQDKIKNVRSAILLNCGFMSGILQAVLFNPWDRALYLSVKHNKPFLHASNFVQPMQGVTQTIFQRAISAGLYFPLEEIFLRHFDNALNPTEENRPCVVFISGILAGATNGMFMNPLSAIKYHMWGQVTTGSAATASFYTAARQMFNKGGIRPFMAGSVATILRDVKFGGVYAIIRYTGNRSYFTKVDNSDKAKPVPKSIWSETAINVLAGCVATIVSSPMNYVRNIHYATLPGTAPADIVSIFLTLHREANKHSHLSKKLQHIQGRLRIGWGTARVGIGMAFASKMYTICSEAS